MQNPKNQALFISYDGHGQNYLAPLFLPIFMGLDHTIVQCKILEFCPNYKKVLDTITEEDCGLIYFENYHNKPPIIGTFWDIIRGALIIKGMVGRGEINVLHPRSHIPGAMALIVKLWEPKVRLVFDTDGLMPDERIDFGGWNRNSLVYKLLRFIEYNLLEQADLVLTRTEQAKNILLERAKESVKAEKFRVIPNGKDTSLFTPRENHVRQQVRKRYGLAEDQPFVVFAGSVGPQYLPEFMFLFFSYLRHLKQNAHFLLLTSGNRESLLELAKSSGVPTTAFTIDYIAPDEVPTILASADVGLALRMPTLSQRAVSPIKVCEYLLCGTPVLANAGIGDLDSIFTTNPGIGYLLQDTSNASLQDAAKWVVESVMPQRKELTNRCRHVGLEQFSLDTVRLKYTEVYESLPPGSLAL